jgi:hypothetical protein
MPKLDGNLETAIHTEDMVRARAFYEGVLRSASRATDPSRPDVRGPVGGRRLT